MNTEMFQIATILWQYVKSRYLQSFQTRSELEEWQNKQVEQLLEKVIALSPFYREYYHSHSINDWRDFPTIDKRMMMENFDQLNTVGIKKEEAFQLALQAEETRDFTPMIKDITIGLSSGTSGNRGLFLVSNQERYRWAGVMLAKILPDSLLKAHRAALFLRANSNLYSSVQHGRITFQFFDLIQPIESHFQPLTEFQPTILVAPPSFLRFLAEEKKKKRLRIQPEKIVSVAEVLEPLDQKVIEDAFEQNVHQIYQCTEGFLGTTCQFGTLHLNEDLVIIQKEYLDKEKGRFSPIITDFHRITQPIIRYRLNDILIEKKEPCPCQSPMLAIESIEGRSDDIFAFPSEYQRKYVMVFPDFIRHAVMTAHPAIQEYLVIQHSTNQLEISLRSPEGMADQTSRAVVQSIRNLCQKLHCRVPDVLFTPYTHKPNIHKLRRVQRVFPLPTTYTEGFYDSEYTSLR